MSVHSYSFHSLSLKLQNRKMSFPFLPLKLSNKRMKEYFKIIIFIHFHSILFSHLKRGLTVTNNQHSMLYYEKFGILKLLKNIHFVTHSKDNLHICNWIKSTKYKIINSQHSVLVSASDGKKVTNIHTRNIHMIHPHPPMS